MEKIKYGYVLGLGGQLLKRVDVRYGEPKYLLSYEPNGSKIYKTVGNARSARTNFIKDYNRCVEYAKEEAEGTLGWKPRTTYAELLNKFELNMNDLEIYEVELSLKKVEEG